MATAPPPLRLAQIGAGHFSSAFLFPQLGAHQVEPVAVCDLVPERAEIASRRFGFGRTYTDFRHMLEAERPDAVICVGGPQVHYEVGRQVLAFGFPLYIQKSPAPSAAQTQELADLAAEHQVVCHVGFNLRSSAAGLAAKAAITDSSFGPTTLVVVRYGLVSGPTLENAVMDQHCHAFDLLRWLGGEVEGLTVERLRVPGVRGYAAVVRFASGAVGSTNFAAGQTPNREFVYFEVTGTDGHYLTSHDFDLVHHAPGRPDEVHTTGNYGGPLGSLSWMGYVADLANFLDAVRGSQADRAPVADTVATMKLCEEAYRQLRAEGAEP